MPSEGEIVGGPPQVSTAEGGPERNIKETKTRDALKSEVDPKVEVDIKSEITEITTCIISELRKI